MQPCVYIEVQVDMHTYAYTHMQTYKQMLALNGSSGGLQVTNAILSATLPGRIADVPTLGLTNTPNRFLQEWLDSAPSVVFTPKVLQPLVMFTGTIKMG